MENEDNIINERWNMKYVKQSDFGHENIAEEKLNWEIIHIIIIINPNIHIYIDVFTKKRHSINQLYQEDCIILLAYIFIKI
jgi:hypothetical protein